MRSHNFSGSEISQNSNNVANNSRICVAVCCPLACLLYCMIPLIVVTQNSKGLTRLFEGGVCHTIDCSDFSKAPGSFDKVQQHSQAVFFSSNWMYIYNSSNTKPLLPSRPCFFSSPTCSFCHPIVLYIYSTHISLKLLHNSVVLHLDRSHSCASTG